MAWAKLQWPEARRWLILAAFALIKLFSVWGKKPLYSGDEDLWERVARYSLFEKSFWTANRPFTAPLLHKLVGFSHDRVIWFQALAGAAAWVTFAFAVSRLMRSKLGADLAFALILALGLTSGVHGWDFVVRSESCSNSCLVLLLAAVLNLLHGASGDESRRFFVWSGVTVVAGFFASFARDSNAYIVALLATFVAVASGVLRWKGRASPLPRSALPVLAATALLLLLTAAAARSNAERSERYRWPLVNVIFKRVLPDRSRLAYFRDELGMPVSRAMLARKHKQMSADNWYVRRAPELASFRTWLVSDGYAGYQRYLLDHPVETWLEALRLVPKHAAHTHFRHTQRGVNPLTSALDRILVGGFSLFPWLFSALATLSALVALRVGDRSLRLLGGLTLFAMLVMLTQAYICFHGDALEVSRHCLNVGLFFWIGAAGGVLVAARLIARRSIR